MTDETLFQQLVNNDEVDKMLADLKDLEPEYVTNGDEAELVEHWELAITFDADDLPRIIEELEELNDDDS